MDAENVKRKLWVWESFKPILLATTSQKSVHEPVAREGITHGPLHSPLYIHPETLRNVLHETQGVGTIVPECHPAQRRQMLTKSIEESWEFDVPENTLNIFEVQRRSYRLPF